MRWSFHWITWMDGKDGIIRKLGCRFIPGRWRGGRKAVRSGQRLPINVEQTVGSIQRQNSLTVYRRLYRSLNAFFDRPRCIFFVRSNKSCHLRSIIDIIVTCYFDWGGQSCTALPFGPRRLGRRWRKQFAIRDVLFFDDRRSCRRPSGTTRCNFCCGRVALCLMVEFLSASSTLKSRRPALENPTEKKPCTYFLWSDTPLSAVTIYKTFFDGLRLHSALITTTIITKNFLKAYKRFSSSGRAKSLPSKLPGLLESSSSNLACQKQKEKKRESSIKGFTKDDRKYSRAEAQLAVKRFCCNASASATRR